ncbi:MAG: hypothetical protein AAF734_09040 [Bacteroidota bacterium]
MKNIRNIFLYLLLHLGLWSCQDDPEPALPEATQTGENTFGCLVDGSTWLPSANQDDIPSFTFSFQQQTLNIEAARQAGNQSSAISIKADSIQAEGIYLLEGSDRDFGTDAATFSKSLPNTNCAYETSAINIGRLEITKLDVTNGIIAGRFEFTLSAYLCVTDEDGCERYCGEVAVTEGRFDITYKP